MKKHNFYFIGECAIILALLVLIGALVKDERHTVQGKEIVIAGVDEETQEESQENFLQKLLSEQKAARESEDEELGMEEENMTDSNANAVTEEKSEEAAVAKAISENTISGNVALENTMSENQMVESTVSGNAAEDDVVKMVVFGDSIWDEGRGTDGISEQVMEKLDVEIYNCAIGGTTAAVSGESTQWYDWKSRSFNGMMYIANGVVSADELIPHDNAYEVIKSVDFNEVDYVIVSYGLNDYFSDIPIFPKEYYDLTSYVGALRHGIHKIREKYPHIEFIVTSPTYCEWFRGERQFELGAYTEAARSVAAEMEVNFLDMYHALGKNPDEKTQYLSDGVHLTSEGRRLYAHSVIEYLKQLESANEEKE